MKLHQHTLFASVLLLSSSALIACGSDDSNAPTVVGTGGVGNGGVVGSGAAPATGGVTPGTGGTVGAGGVGTGGVTPGSGGATPGTGGGVGSGGVGAGGAATGGTTGTGGSSGVCTTEGTYGILFEVSIQWASTLVLSCPNGPCKGTQQLKLLSQRTVDAQGNVTDTAKICSVAIPQFTTIIGKTTVIFPEAAWDTKPVETILKSKLTGTGVGATFTSDDNGIIVGATLANPVTDAWPTPTATQGVDADNDTKPGVTATVQEPEGVVTTIGLSNADRLYIAFRTVASVTGKNDTCDRSTGTINLKKVEQNILGCRQVTGGTDCSAGQVNDINSNSPKWTVGTDPTKFVMVRMPSTATCADVRAAQF